MKKDSYGSSFWLPEDTRLRWLEENCRNWRNTEEPTEGDGKEMENMKKYNHSQEN